MRIFDIAMFILHLLDQNNLLNIVLHKVSSLFTNRIYISNFGEKIMEKLLVIQG